MSSRRPWSAATPPSIAATTTARPGRCSSTSATAARPRSIAQADELLFVKYIDIGGQHFDLAVARHLKMDLHEAVALRKHNGDRRADMQDPEVARSVAEAIAARRRAAGQRAGDVRPLSQRHVSRPADRADGARRRRSDASSSSKRWASSST